MVHFETRVFFTAKDMRSLPSLASAQVMGHVLALDEVKAAAAATTFSELPLERRTDAYMFLPAPHGERVGLKARGGHSSKIEVKLGVDAEQLPYSSSLAAWEKYTGKAVLNDVSGVLKFLASVGHPLTNWVSSTISGATAALPTVLVEKERRCSDLGAFDYEETDITFTTPAGKQVWRSWAAESKRLKPELVALSQTWEAHVRGIAGPEAVVVVASYPEMVHKIFSGSAVSPNIVASVPSHH